MNLIYTKVLLWIIVQMMLNNTHTHPHYNYIEGEIVYFIGNS